MHRHAILALLLLLLPAALVTQAGANSVELLSFNGLRDLQPVENFYNGSGLASTPNYGVSFSSNFYGLRSVYVGGAGGFLPDPTATPAIFINGATGSSTTGFMNVGPGFTTGINFFYTAAFKETMTIWSGANGTGTVLATLALVPNNNSCVGFPTYCNWTSVGLSFAGTAKSVSFSGAANGIGIADVTLGQSLTAVPEPSSLLFVGAGLASLIPSFHRRSTRRRALKLTDVDGADS